MSSLGVLSQLLAMVVALLLAPLLTGWVNQWRARLQNKSAPGLAAALPHAAQVVQQGIA